MTVTLDFHLSFFLFFIVQPKTVNVYQLNVKISAGTEWILFDVI